MISNVKLKLKKIVRALLGALGYRLVRLEASGVIHECEAEAPYQEREEAGAFNLEVKLARVEKGQPFEWPDIVNLNNAVLCFIEGEKKIAELGSGTGKFASDAASVASRHVIASEFDELAHRWCLKEIPARENLVFIHGPIPEHMCPFELSVSIEVVEHIKDYRPFLESMSALAPRSLLTTPNRNRSTRHATAGPPEYFGHVREWSAGEFYWVLRCFWRDVRLYAMTSRVNPTFMKVDVNSTLSPLIADCRDPIRVSRVDSC